MSRKALMVCYYFPPILSTGVTRSRSFAELLPTFGWTPVVLSVKNCRDPWVKIGTESAKDVRVERSSEWNLALYDLIPADELDFKGTYVKDHVKKDGIGAPLVAKREWQSNGKTETKHSDYGGCSTSGSGFNK